jgi:hypothetical protein
LNRKTLTRILPLGAALACLTPAVMAQGINVEVDGQRVFFNNARPQMISERVMVPLRGVLEQMGAYVQWDSSTRMVTARKGEFDIAMRIGQRAAQVNGRTTYLDVPAMILHGSTMVPLRFMSEALGADVDWIAATQTVRIDTSLDVSDPRFPTPPPPTTNPTIYAFRVDAPNGVLRAGDMIRMELRGTPSADVHFSIPGVTDTKRMREESPGVYVAEWTVPRNADGLRESAIYATLTAGGTQRTIRATEDAGDLPPRDTLPPTISDFEPKNAERVNTARPLIQARIQDRGEAGVNTNSWRLYVDGEDVTQEAVYSNGVIRYRPLNDLTVGTHRVRLEAEDRSGNRSSASWNFTVGRDDGGNRGDFIVTAPRTLRAGDQIQFRLLAEPGARVTYSIGTLVQNRLMAETSSGVFAATYTVQRGDEFRGLPIVARVRTQDGFEYTVHSETVLESGLNPSAPKITTPAEGDKVGNSMIVRAQARDAESFEVKVDYVTFLGGLRLTGVVHQQVYRADRNGQLVTEPIDLGTLIRGQDTEYTITVTAIAADGTRSEPTVTKVKR